MLDEAVLVDTGAILAIYNAKDAYHEACKTQSEELLVGKSFTCWPVITEAAYMLRNHTAARAHLLGRVHSQEFALLPLSGVDVPEINQIFAKYHDQQIDLADACLLHLADREDINAVFTLDRRHFSVFRRANGKALRLLPE